MQTRDDFNSTTEYWEHYNKHRRHKIFNVSEDWINQLDLWVRSNPHPKAEFFPIKDILNVDPRQYISQCNTWTDLVDFMHDGVNNLHLPSVLNDIILKYMYDTDTYLPDSPRSIFKSILEINDFMELGGNSKNHFLEKYVHKNKDQITYNLSIFHIPMYDHTIQLMELVGDGTLLRYCHRLNKEDVRYIFEEELKRVERGEKFIRNDPLREIADLLLIKYNKTEYTVDDMHNDFITALMASLVSTPEHQRPKRLLSILNMVTHGFNEIKTTTISQDNFLTTHEYRPIAEFLKNNTDHFYIHEIAIMILTLSYRSQFSRSGTNTAFVSLINEIIENDETYKNAHDFVRLVADVILTYDGPLPTVAEWRKILIGNDIIPMSDITINMVGAKPSERRIIGITHQIRSIFE